MRRLLRTAQLMNLVQVRLSAIGRQLSARPCSLAAQGAIGPILALFCVVPLVSHRALADFDPPAGYYDYASGSGATLKQQLHVLIDAVDDPNIDDVVETPMSYDAARSTLQVTDADPNHAGYMLSVYDRTSVHVAAINPGGTIPGWDNGTTWNREHTWPRSRGVGSSGPDDSDLFEIRPSLTSKNGDRADLNFGGAFGAQSYGTVVDGGQTYWYPGDADAGMIARQEFYMAVRYDGTEANTQDLEIGTGNVANPSGSEDLPPQLGNLTRLLEWHYAAPPDSFERNRNQIIFTSYQHNRDPFVDHPEWVWSVFVNQANNSQISIAGTAVDANGGSSKTVDLGRVLVNGAVPSPRAFSLNKTGSNGTYYEVTTSGEATSSVLGRLNAFRTNQTDSAAISVGLDTTTATAGMRSGTVTVDNLDVTAGGGAGKGANDANDTFNMSLNVLDHMTPSFTSPSLVTTKTLDFGNLALGSSSPTLNFDVFDLEGVVGSTANMDFDSVTPSGNSAAFTTNLAASAGLLQIAAGDGHTFMTSMNATAVGTFLATYTLMFSDEDLPGAQSKSISLTLTGTVRLAGDYNGDGRVDASDYVVWRQSVGQTGVTPYSGADGDGNTAIDANDYQVWRENFGQTASGAGTAFGSAAVPEPATLWLAMVSLMAAASLLARSARPVGRVRRTAVDSFTGRRGFGALGMLGTV